MDIYKKGVAHQKKNHALFALNIPGLLQKTKNISTILIRGLNVKVAVAKKLIFSDPVKGIVQFIVNSIGLYNAF